MIRHAFIFLGTFVAGAVVALVVRAALHDPYAAPAAPETRPVAEAVPAATAAAPAPAPAHDHASSGSAAVDSKPVNTVCAICGMDVDPAIPTAEYQGRTIGFGCAMCPPKFRAEPDKYGPAALENRVVED